MNNPCAVVIQRVGRFLKRKGFMPATATLALVATLVGAATPCWASSFTPFETGQVRPVAISPGGKRLYVANTPDDRVEVFTIGASGLSYIASIPVGMEPTAMAFRNNSELWVTNHLSDSVSIIRVDLNGGHVVRTLRVGDEPNDIVFGGPQKDRAFIATAHRDLDRPSGSEIGSADIWVFDANNLGAPGTGTPIAVINLFSEAPRGLAVSPDGNSVYAAAFLSGNKSTVVSAPTLDGDLPPPLTNADGVPAPLTGLIVQYDGVHWIDGAGRDLSSLVPISLPDYDVFKIDASLATPAVTQRISGVGTVLFNLAVNPASGKVYVSNTEALNRIRFVGPGDFGGSTLRGHFDENRISIIDGTNVLVRRLNKHIDYNTFPGTQAENDASLAFPGQMVVSADGSTLYVAAFGSGKVGIFSTSALENDTFVPSAANHIEVTGGGPSGLVLDEALNRLYVLTRFDNSVSVIDLASRTEIGHVAMHNPEPASIVAGRPFLYDARYTSSRGNSACASCHIFGDLDSLAWDLGNPDASVKPDPNPFVEGFPEPGVNTDFHPMKGPMTTQSLRGLANHGPMHWRGDQTGGDDVNGDPLDENAAFKKFNGAFEDLLGRTAPLTDTEMQEFADFALQIMYPPNPNRNLDNSLTPAQARGRDTYLNAPVEVATGQTCNFCHVLDPEQGFFGSSGLSTTRKRRPDSPVLKVPHLRNIYAKMAAPETVTLTSGDQIRGFFLSHDGSVTNLLRFLSSGEFDFPGGFQQRTDMIEFLRVFDTNLAPMVGQQLTINADSDALSLAFLNTMIERAKVTTPLPECDLIAKGRRNGEDRGWVLTNSGSSVFLSDRVSEGLYTLNQLKKIALKQGQELTFTCVPPGNGVRDGVDRDEDGAFDRDEIDAGTDPADPGSTPAIANGAQT